MAGPPGWASGAGGWVKRSRSRPGKSLDGIACAAAALVKNAASTHPATSRTAATIFRAPERKLRPYLTPALPRRPRREWANFYAPSRARRSITGPILHNM